MLELDETTMGIIGILAGILILSGWVPQIAKGYRTKKGTIRCRLHGGFSNGQTTLEGKIKAYKNLPQFKNLDDKEVRTYITNRTRHHQTTDERNTFDANMLERKFSKLIESL